METQDFFKEWVKKHPKSLDEFIKYITNSFFDYFAWDMYYFIVEIKLEESNQICDFKMLSGVIKAFFKENNIDISTCINKPNWDYMYEINHLKMKMGISSCRGFDTDEEALKKGILKAAEILEKELK